MKKDNRIYLQHILEAAKEILAFTEGYSEDQFLRDRKTQLAVIRNIEVIGEAAKRISVDFRKEKNQIEWKAIAGMRDKLIHDYMDVDYRTVWEVAEKDIPKLKDEIEELLSEL